MIVPEKSPRCQLLTHPSSGVVPGDIAYAELEQIDARQRRRRAVS